MNMLEKAARALEKQTTPATWTDAVFDAWWQEGKFFTDRVTVWPCGFVGTRKEYRIRQARTVLIAIGEPDEATANRASDIAYEGKNTVSGETCPVMRNHVRSYVDAILEGESK